jgi:hypothetical protein
MPSTGSMAARLQRHCELGTGLRPILLDETAE